MKVGARVGEAHRPSNQKRLPASRKLRFAALPLLISLSGCGGYAEFTLPPLSGGQRSLSFGFDEHPEPVLKRGASPDVLNPSVVDGHEMYYSVFDGRTWHTALATSDSGLRWETRGEVLSPDPRTWEGSYIAANGSALRYMGQAWYWYVAGPKELPRIGLAKLPHKLSHPVLDPGPFMSWDERGVADPYVIRIDPYFYLYYLGQDRARRQRLGVARSSDGVRWEKLRSNPILELGDAGAFDGTGLGEPAVWSSHGFYWMLYTGRDSAENRRMGLARSTDGVHWQKLPAVFSGAQSWDSKVVCDPSVIVDGPDIRVWFGGGDVARPDENLNGQIGYGVLRAVKGTVEK